jgi:ABC-2 type transport system ATP-binding protein
MKQKLALSCTLIHNPVVLFLDEPTTGVDPVSRSEFWEILQELKKEGVTILVSTPYMDEALLCDRMAIMHEGSILAAGKPESITGLMHNHVYKITGRDLVLRSNLIAQIPEIISVQSFGDSLHLTVSPGFSHEQVSSRISYLLGNQLNIERIAPSLEDVFIGLIEGKIGHGG